MYYGYYQLVEQLRRPLQYIQMSVSNWIEAPRVDADSQLKAPPFSKPNIPTSFQILICFNYIVFINAYTNKKQLGCPGWITVLEQPYRLSDGLRLLGYTPASTLLII